MEWMKAVFSPTGTTEAVAAAVAEGAGGTARTVDLSAFVAPETLGEDTVLLAAVPVYGGRVPAVALERLAALKGNGSPAVAVVVYGNRAYEDALLELKDESVRHGFLPVAAGAFIGRHSFTEKLGGGRPDASDLEQAAGLGRSVAALLADRDPADLVLEVPGHFPYTPRSDMPIAPATNRELCTNCGLCRKNCPVQAIDPMDPAVIDGWRCLTCAKCIQSCPTHAKYIGIPAMREKIAILEAMFSAPKQPELFLPR